MQDQNGNYISQFIQDWWGFAVFLGTLAIGWLLGQARRSWTVEQQSRRIVDLQKDLDELKKIVAHSDLDIARFQERILYIQKGLDEIKATLNRLEEKRDK